jgi:hypothetical protein
MNLARVIRSDRARQRHRLPREPGIFQVLGCIVKAHGLKRDFLERLKRAVGDRRRNEGQSLRVRAKSALEVPPFVLVSWEEYGLVREIMATVDNPYLVFARSPEEILLSTPLHEKNPALEPGELLHHEFETLLMAEEARGEIRDGGSGSPRNPPVGGEPEMT